MKKTTLVRNAVGSLSMAALALAGCAGNVGTNGEESAEQALAPGAFSPAKFDPSKDVGQDFTTATGWDHSVWTNTYGSGTWFSKTENGVLLAMSAPSWQTTAFQAQTYAGNCAAGFGYGTFHVRAGIPAAQTKQGPGVNIILWRMDNDWIDGKLGDIITEDDIMEAWSENGQGTATRHFYDASKKNGSTNGQLYSGLGDVTGLHDFDEVWAAGSMTLYKDGVQVSHLTGSQVPTDHAHGGCNYSLGTQVIKPNGYTEVGLPTVQLWVANAWHSDSTSAPAGGGGGSTPPSPTNDAGTSSPPTTDVVTLVVEQSKKCVDVPGASDAQNVQLEQLPCSTATSQRFTMKKNGNGTTTFVNESSGQCVDIRSNSADERAVIQQHDCNGTTAQQFTLKAQGAGFAIETVHGKCLDVKGASTADGAALQQWDCTGAANQTFAL